MQTNDFFHSDARSDAEIISQVVALEAIHFPFCINEILD